MPKIELETKHVQESLSSDILIGSDNAADRMTKRFCFNPWANEYRIYHGKLLLDSGNALEEMLEEYNNL